MFRYIPVPNILNWDGGLLNVTQRDDDPSLIVHLILSVGCLLVRSARYRWVEDKFHSGHDSKEKERRRERESLFIWFTIIYEYTRRRCNGSWWIRRSIPIGAMTQDARLSCYYYFRLISLFVRFHSLVIVYFGGIFQMIFVFLSFS